MLNLYFYPGLFSLGLAVGVLSLTVLLSLIVSYAYDERTLLALAAYVALMACIPAVLPQAGVAEKLVQQIALVLGPTAAVMAQMWLMRGRTTENSSKVAMALTLLAGCALRPINPPLAQASEDQGYRWARRQAQPDNDPEIGRAHV